MSITHVIIRFEFKIAVKGAYYHNSLSDAISSSLFASESFVADKRDSLG